MVSYWVATLRRFNTVNMSTLPCFVKIQGIVVCYRKSNNKCKWSKATEFFLAFSNNIGFRVEVKKYSTASELWKLPCLEFAPVWTQPMRFPSSYSTSTFQSSHQFIHSKALIFRECASLLSPLFTVYNQFLICLQL